MNLSALILPLLLSALALYGTGRRVNVYAALTHGAEEGLTVLLHIIPALVALLTAVSMLRASGAMELLSRLCAPLFDGPDSTVGRVAAVMMGSTETTFYTIAVYFGSAGIVRTRHTVPAALAADFTGFLAAAWTVRLFFGP